MQWASRLPTQTSSPGWMLAQSAPSSDRALAVNPAIDASVSQLSPTPAIRVEPQLSVGKGVQPDATQSLDCALTSAQ